MRTSTLTLVLSAVVLMAGPAAADDLTRIIQQDLVALGYDPGNTDGEATTQTVIAISKFQAEHDLEVTGEPTPQLAGVIKAAIKNQSAPVAGAAAGVTPPPQRDAAALQAAQQACLEEKIAAAQAANKKKKGLDSLMRVAARTASRFGGDAGQDIAQASRDIYDVNATAADLESAARDLGLAEDDIEECRNPPM